MIITIKQNEIIDAIKQYLRQSGISVADNTAVEMTSTRGADGVTATIDLGATKAEPNTGCGTDSSGSVLSISGEPEPEMPLAPGAGECGDCQYQGDCRHQAGEGLECSFGKRPYRFLRASLYG